MSDLTRHCCLDILWELPAKHPIKSLASLHTRARPLIVFSTRLPFYLRPFRRFHRLNTREQELWLLHLTDLAHKKEGKILSLFAGTPEAAAFLEANRETLEPFYCLYPKGVPHDD